MKYTKALQDITCPKCSKYGQLKIRIRKNNKYYYVDHYRSKRHIKYLSCCYIGNVKNWKEHGKTLKPIPPFTIL